MTFARSVVVQSESGRYIFRAHAAQAIRMCQRNQAKRLTSGTIQLVTSTAAIRNETLPKIPKVDTPKRLSYGGHTTPNQDRKTFAPCLFRADTGQTATIRRVFLRQS